MSQACPLFVSLAEEGWIEDDITMAVAHRYLDPVIAEGIDVLVLGCTHYPLLKPCSFQIGGRFGAAGRFCRGDSRSGTADSRGKGTSG